MRFAFFKNSLVHCSRSFGKFGNFVKHMSKQKQPLPVPAEIRLTVIGTGAPGTPRALIISTDLTKYLINSGEGTQRILSSNKLGGSKLCHIFVTRQSWENTSGLLGMALTLKSSTNLITLHGPPGAEQVVRMTKRFLDSEASTVVTSNILKEPFVDHAFEIRCIPVKAVSESSGEPKEKVMKIEEDVLNTSYAYLFKPKQLDGCIDLNKCVEVGIPREFFRSPIMGDLKRGESFTLPNGKIVRPEDVVLPPVITKSILVLECPSTAYLEAFLSNPELQALGPEDADGSPDLIVHMGPHEVLSCSEYSRFMSLFPSAKHLIMDGRGNSMALEGIYQHQAVLNEFVDARVFPLLIDQVAVPDTEVNKEEECEDTELNKEEKCEDTELNKEEVCEDTELNKEEECERIVHAKPLITYKLRPNKGFVDNHTVVIDKAKFLEEPFESRFITREMIETAIKENAERVKALEATIPPRDARPYPRVTFLGTGSAVPSKHRNISCILLEVDANSILILDCGESSLNQCFSLFGEEGTHKLLRKLKLVAVSHMHADHHGGLFRILEERNKVLQADGISSPPPVAIIAPNGLKHWATVYDDIFGSRTHEEHKMFILNSYCPPSNVLNTEVEWYEEFQECLKAIGIQIFPIRVPHTYHSWGFAVSGGFNGEPHGPWKIVYSGDTEPSDNMVKYGADCDLLIHEATMENGLEAMARMKKHCTVNEAISAGRAMRAKFILLNHFSQRYPKLPPRLDENYTDVAPSFDFLQVTLNDLAVLPTFLPLYRYIFSDSWRDMERRAELALLNREEAAKKEIETCQTTPVSSEVASLK